MSHPAPTTLAPPHAGVPANPPASRCANHRGMDAGWRCMGCAQTYCQDCLVSRVVDNAEILQCPACGNEPVSLAPSVARPSFYQKLPGAPLYPLKGWGILQVLFGAIMIAATSFACRFSLRALPVALGLAGYTFAYMILIINRTGDGDRELPNWPSATVGLITTFFMMVFTFLLSFLPVILYAAGMHFLALPFKFIILPVYASLFFLPMAMLRVAMFQTLEALNPLAVIRSIFQIPTAYMTACIIFFLLVYVRMTCGVLLQFVPVAGGLLDTFIALYLTLVEVHVLGLLYYAYQETFDWFGDL